MGPALLHLLDATSLSRAPCSAPCISRPPQVKCGWAGLGSVGCSGKSCSVYIKGGYANDLLVHMHELGHTQGLSHAGRGLDEVRVWDLVGACAPGEGAGPGQAGGRQGWQR